MRHLFKDKEKQRGMKISRIGHLFPKEKCNLNQENMTHF